MAFANRYCLSLKKIFELFTHRAPKNPPAILQLHHVYSIFVCTETWPSGKAEACKAFIPGSNPGVSFFNAKNQFCGRLAQLVAHHIDIVGVAGSSPVPPTIEQRYLYSASVLLCLLGKL